MYLDNNVENSDIVAVGGQTTPEVDDQLEWT
jgi:hypothetical protein